MATTNNNQPVDMKQLWQQCEPAPTASSALSCMTTSEDGSDRFIYYIVSGLFYRYDNYGNTWQKLAAPLVTPTVFASMRYAKFGGTFGRVLSATSNTVRLGAMNWGYAKGKKILITQGTGAGQKRIISASAEPVKYEQGLATTATANTLGDSTKKWKFNQWAGYQVRITFGTGNTQIRRILYNDTTTLTLYDINYQPRDSFNNQGFAVAPVTTAGLQAHFVIEASDLTVDTAWTIQPDYSSRFKIETGGIWLFTSATASPFYSIQYYDVAGDYWSAKTATANLVTAAWGTDGSLERTGEIGGIYESGTATSASDYTLVDTTKSFTLEKYKNYRIRITGGTGIGQSRRILCNDGDNFEVARKWEVNPDATSTYEIIADKDKIYLAGNAQSRLLQYDVDSDLTLVGSKYDNGVAMILSASHLGIDQDPIAITSGTRTTTGIISVDSAPTVGGTLYSIGDILTVTTGGTNGKVIVESIAPGGIVTAVSLIRPGATYTIGTGKVTSGGTGTGCTINILTVGTTCAVTTAIIHNFRIGEQVVLAGDTNYAGTVTILGVDSTTAFYFATSAVGNMTALNALSATVTVDCSKNWTVNEHKGKILQTHVVGLAGIVQPRVILSNTATTITTDTITTALVNGTGRYVIVSPSSWGRDDQRKDPTQKADGHASSGSTTSLTDATKNWVPNMWVNSKVRIEAGTGRDTILTVLTNTNNTITFATQAFSPDTTTHYRIQDTYGVCSAVGSTSTIVDTSQNWAVNQWAGKRLYITGGAGFGLAALLNEVTIISNTSTVLTFTAVTGFAPDTTTIYTIIGKPQVGAGIELLWIFGGISQGKYMFLPRGSVSNTSDRYDITSERWEYGFHFSPQTDTMTTGTSYAYDGVNRVYYAPAVATGAVQYVYYYDITDNRAYGLGSIPNTQSTAVLGNRMEIIDAPSGISYLYVMRNTATEIYRCQLFF